MNSEFDRKLQIKLTNMLSWFHDFCVENNLRYFALGGTMLGAVRHGGFIPWDDDIDVGMPRADYEKLYYLLKDKNDCRFVLETPYSLAKDFNYCFFKLYDTETTLVENLKYKVKRGIYIDVFPLDGMGDTEEESRATFNLIDRKFKLLLAHTTGIRRGRSILKNIAVVFCQSVLSPFINDKAEIRKLNELLSLKDFDKCVYGGNPFGAWRYKEIMRRDIIGTPTLYKFENINIFGVQNYDEYLTHLYGDWRKLPPKDKQISHHNYAELDLDKSFLE